MRTIEAKEITALVRELCMKANYVLPEDILSLIHISEPTRPY